MTDHNVTQPTDEQRGLTTCWQNLGWHVYGAGPCFDTKDQAIVYRNSLDAEGVMWRSQPLTAWER